MAGLTSELDATAGDKTTTHDGLLRRAGLDQIIKDAVDDGFVERGVIAITRQIELQ